MREFSDHYEEDYLYLADVTHDAALIAWGKFFFNSKMKLVKDKKIHMLEGQHGRHTSIGANCESYGTVVVEVRNVAGAVVNRVETDKTYTWVDGLAADTDYTYHVLVPETGGRRAPGVWVGFGTMLNQKKSCLRRRANTGAASAPFQLPTRTKIWFLL